MTVTETLGHKNQALSKVNGPVQATGGSADNCCLDHYPVFINVSGVESFKTVKTGMKCIDKHAYVLRY